MDEKFRKFKRDTETHINSSEWLCEEAATLEQQIQEAIETDFDIDYDYLNELLKKADYLQGKILAEQKIYQNIVNEHKEFIL